MSNSLNLNLLLVAASLQVAVDAVKVQYRDQYGREYRNDYGYDDVTGWGWFAIIGSSVLIVAAIIGCICCCCHGCCGSKKQPGYVVVPNQQQAQPATTTTVVMAPQAPAPQQQPVVINNHNTGTPAQGQPMYQPQPHYGAVQGQPPVQQQYQQAPAGIPPQHYQPSPAQVQHY